MSDLPPALELFAARLSPLGWVSDLFVGGSLATGDHVAGVSDLDLVALTDGPVDQACSPRSRAAWIAWRDVRRTVAQARRAGS